MFRINRGIGERQILNNGWKLQDMDESLNAASSPSLRYMDNGPSLPVATLVLDNDLKISSLSNEFIDLFQLDALTSKFGSAQELFQTLFPNTPVWLERCRKALEEHQYIVKTVPYLVMVAPEEYRWLQWTILPWMRSNTEQDGIIIQVRDISKEYRHRRFYEMNLDILCIAEHTGYFREVSPSFSEALGYSIKDLCTHPFMDFIHPDDKEATLGALELLKNGGMLTGFENRYRKKDGEYRLLHWTCCPDPLTGSLYAVARDITETKANQQALLKKNKLLNNISLLQEWYISGMDQCQLFNNALEHILEICESKYGFIAELHRDIDDNPYYISLAITDISWDEATRELYATQNLNGLEFRDLNSLFGHTARTSEIVISNDPANDPRGGGLPKGHSYLKHYMGIPIFGDNGMIALMGIADRVGGYDESLLEDIQPYLRILGAILDAKNNARLLNEERENLRLANEQLEKLALNDYLTGLANRVQFEKQLSQAMEKARRSHHTFALLYMDLDNFKRVNDNLGHDVGDKLLKQVAERLQNCLRSYDFIARLGGDEFAVIVEDFDDHHQLGHLAQRLIDDVRIPFAIGSSQCMVGLSIGIAYYSEEISQSHVLAKNADLSLYLAKSHGGNQYSFFTEELNTRHQHRMQVEHGLQTAVDSQQLSLLYQPIWDINTNQTIAVEALLRWRHPQLGLVMPGDFIPIAEDIGIMDNLGYWVFINASEDYQEYIAPYNQDLLMTVNFSACQFRDDHCLQDIEKYLNSHEENIHGNFILELTESAMMNEQEFLRSNLELLERNNIHLAIDDFGTGFSNHRRLAELPISILKIDASITAGLESDSKYITILDSILHMAKALKAKVVAEGVETQHQLDILREHGCELAQGFFLAKPMPANELKSLLQQNPD